MGRPSKYLAFPDASCGIEAVVTLNLANLAIPEQTNIVRKRVSRGKRRPKAKAAKAGAAPNDS